MLQRILIQLVHSGMVVGAVILMLMTLGQASTVSAQSGSGTIRVTTTGTDAAGCGSAASPCRTIQYAVNIAASGDTIKIARGTYTGSGSAVASLQFISGAGKNLTFMGGFTPPDWTTPSSDPTQTILDGQNARHGFEIISVPSVSISILGLTVENGYEGSPIPYSGEYTGGGLVCRNDDPNTPQYISLTISNVIFRNNRVQGSGNKASSGGGAAFYLRCRATLTDVTFDSNTVLAGNATDGYRGGYALGGGLFATAQSDVTATRVTFTNNSVTAGSGGIGLGADGWSTPDGLGGGAAFQSNNVTLNDVTVTNNRTAGGGGSQRAGTGAGGGLFFEFSTATITGGMLKANSATGGASTVMGGIASGGGIMTTDSTLILSRLKVLNNSSIGGAGSDGGDAGGGGIYSTRVSTSYAGSVTGTNVILADNVTQAGAGANRWGGGGAVFNQNATLNLTHSTIAQNSVLSTMQGPAIVGLNYLGSSSTSLAYSIVASHGNTGAAIIIQKAGDSGSFNYTLFYNNTGGKYGCQPGMSGCSITNSNEVPSGNPSFISPGSPNYNYLIGSGSAAKDKATASSTARDIQNYVRPFNGVADVGAHEYGASAPVLVPVPIALPMILK